MKYKVGFLGGGNIAKAIIGGFINGGLFKAEHIIASARTDASVKGLQSKFGIDATGDNLKIVQESEIVIIAVKPYMIESVMKPLKSELKPSQIIISVAAGVDTSTLVNYIGEGINIFRVMPNTPAQVGAGMSVIFSDQTVSNPSLATVKKLFEAIGKVEIVSEKLVHACIALQGSSPAYMFMILEAMGDAGVQLGLPRDVAYTMAAQSMLGSAQMLLETGSHPGVLKDMVTSPGGTTIEAVVTMEGHGLRNAMIQGMLACANKSSEMSKK